MNPREELKDVIPFPEVESVISEILTNHVFSEKRGTASFYIDATGKREEDLIPEDRSPFHPPRIEVCFKSKSLFVVYLEFEFRPWGDMMISRLNNSKFVDDYCHDEYFVWNYPHIELETDPDTLARFVSYHMRL
ncbi:MAG: hypothetical protein K2K72_03225 [Duncaniella sp.]|nr:hypothetical protein [Duncaniella sp.]